MTLSMLAPSGAAATFTSRSGAVYTPDINGVILNIASGDAVDLLQEGCSFLTLNPDGKNNLSAVTAPAVTDDSGDDYAIGSLWLDTTNKQIYECLDATVGASVWGRVRTAGIVNTTAATLAVTAAANAGKINTLNKANGQTVTLPAATGTGNTYAFVLNTTVTSVGTVIKVANGTDIIQGIAAQAGSAGAATSFIAGATDDTITLNGSTTGGFKGDIVTFVDTAAGIFSVQASTQITGTAATPFSATV